MVIDLSIVMDFENLILESVQEAVIATDLDGYIVYWNKGATLLYGWEKDEIIGKYIVDVIPSKVSHEQGEDIMKSLVKGDIWTGQFACQKRDGTEFMALVTDRPMYDKDGKFCGIVGTSVDMKSEYVRHQIATSAVAHELRAPVTGMIGMISSMIEDRRSSIEDLEILLLSSHTLLNFINNLIELPKTNPDASSNLNGDGSTNKVINLIDKCNIRRIAKSVVGIMRPLGREDETDIILSVEDSLPRTILVPSVIKIQQAFFNLISNAVKYTKPKSTIECCILSYIPPSLSTTDDSDATTIDKSISNDSTMIQNVGYCVKYSSFLVPGRQYIITRVKDSGSGISEDDYRKVCMVI